MSARSGRRAARPVPARRAALAALAVVALLGTGCGATTDDPDRGSAADRSATSGASTGPAAEGVDRGAAPRCPRLEPARPVAGGLPPLRLPCLGEGPPVRLSDLRGVPTVVNVWAAWCTNCDREMPLFARAMERYGDQVRFFGVHYKAARGHGLASVRDFGVPFPSVHDEDGDRTVEQLGVYAPPQTLFVTAQGRVAGRAVGEIPSQQRLDALLRRYLGVRA